MNGQLLRYASLEDIEYLRILKSQGLRVILVEQDQYPEEHLVIMAVKPGASHAAKSDHGN
jgi:hypothetical protein